MGSLTIVIYLITLIFLSLFATHECSNEKTFCKTVLSKFEYKIILGMAYTILIILSLPIFGFLLLDVKNGDPLACFVALFYALVFSLLAWKQIKSKLKTKK